MWAQDLGIAYLSAISRAVLTRYAKPGEAADLVRGLLTVLQVGVQDALDHDGPLAGLRGSYRFAICLNKPNAKEPGLTSFAATLVTNEEAEPFFLIELADEEPKPTWTEHSESRTDPKEQNAAVDPSRRQHK